MTEIWAADKYSFNDLAMRLFQYQAKNNKVYAQFLSLIDKKPEMIHQVDDIPFLPISFFKTQRVICENAKSTSYFESSSTTGKGVSKHYISEMSNYLSTAERGFKLQFGPVQDYQFVALLPNYLERQHSSLVAMVDHFIERSSTPTPTHFLYDHAALNERLVSERPTVLFGVSFALLDFAKKYRVKHPSLIVIETGGMKGRKKEITKAEVYQELQQAFPTADIRSEYGMTELFSQAYTDRDGLYVCPPWMKVFGRLDNDPFSKAEVGSRAALNIIDLANIHSCAFIATDDLGRIQSDGRFEVLGRIDQSDLRGCSLMLN